MDKMCLLEKARKEASSSTATAIAGNAIVLATMCTLYEILEDQAANPTDNMTSIVALAGSIAALSSSINTSIKL